MRNVHGFLVCLGVAALSSVPATAQVVSGNITFTATPDSATSLATPLVDLGRSTTSGLVSSASVAFLTETNARATITFSGSAGLYNGATGVAVAPQLAGTTLSSNYLAAQPNGNVTITYAAPQTFFGINWGSVDTYNSLSFYNNGVRVASLTGSQVLSSASVAGFSTANVSVNFNSGTSFTSVVAQSTSPAFEFGLLRSSAARVAPSPTAGSTPLGAAFAGLLLWLCYRTRNANRRNAD
jgi:hypothetical protein